MKVVTRTTVRRRSGVRATIHPGVVALILVTLAVGVLLSLAAAS
jgi:hypothetical protein